MPAQEVQDHECIAWYQNNVTLKSKRKLTEIGKSTNKKNTNKTKDGGKKNKAKENKNPNNKQANKTEVKMVTYRSVTCSLPETWN